MDTEFYVYLRQQDDPNQLTDSGKKRRLGEFTNVLPFRINLNEGIWQVGLKQFSAMNDSNLKRLVYLYCDLVEDSVVSNYRKCIINKVFCDGNAMAIQEWSSPLYFNIKRREFGSITVAFSTHTQADKHIPARLSKLEMTLHFRRIY